MLKNVQIKNLALIKEADIDFGSGLNILTGETGAGKSIIISAINLALGEKANKTMIRSGEDHGFVELVFIGVNENVLRILKDNDIEPDDNSVIISRKITKDLSINRVNGHNVTLNTLKQVTSLLIDIHGQHDHQSLLDQSKHIDIVDAFGGMDTDAVKKELAAEHSYYRNLRLEYKKYDKTKEDLAHEIGLLEYEIREIDDTAIETGEDERLEEEFRHISNSEKTAGLVKKAGNEFCSENDNVTDRISEALKNISDACAIDPRFEQIKNTLMDLEAVSKDAGRQIEHLMNDIGFDPERFALVKQRLDQINHLKSKYGNTVQQINEYRNDLEQRIEQYNSYFDRKAELEKKIHESALKLNEISNFLSVKRKSIAAELEPLISKNLKELNFADARFEIRIDKLERITENGYDRIEFLISANPGEPLKPLAKVASGGEISRIMLAIKTVLASKDEIDTLIFDEIDTGISGKTAHLVSQKLYDLSRERQVICISHLPQIAAMADSHFHIHKESGADGTISGIIKLNDEQMIKEIAKLVGGADISPAAMENARDLKGNANFFKHKLT